jgi:hypothetical protein
LSQNIFWTRGENSFDVGSDVYFYVAKKRKEREKERKKKHN